MGKWILSGAASLWLGAHVSTCFAFAFKEHHDAVCDGLALACETVKALPETEPAGAPAANDCSAPRPECAAKEHEAYVRRRQLAIGMLCLNQCGNPRKLNIQPTEPPWVPLFADSCSLDFGDAVALIDHAHARELRNMSCQEVSEKRADLINYGLEALFADEHFCPRAVSAYVEFHRAARAIALAATQLDVFAIPEQLRIALFGEAEALHYFTDSFAAGHQMARLGDSIDPLVTKSTHDYYNAHGRLYTTHIDATPKLAFGDNHLAAAQRAEIAHAVQTSIEEVVISFIKAELVDKDATRMQPLCPDVTAADATEEVKASLHHHRGELRIGFDDFVQPSVGDELTDSLILAGIASYVRPLTAWLNCEGAAEVSTWRAARTLAELNQRGQPSYEARSAVLSFGCEAAPIVWRTFRVVGRLAPLRLSVVDIFDSTPGPWRVGGFYDGFQVGTGTELSALHFALRAGLDVGMRRRAHGDGLGFVYGPHFSAAYRW